MIDLNDKTALEFYFADHFDTALFPVLANIYLQNGDIYRAKKVCEIGLGYAPRHIEGLFTLAKVYLAEGNLKNAENVLEKLLKNKSFHHQANILFAHIQTELKRSPKKIKSNWERVLKNDPHHIEAENALKTLQKKNSPQKIKKTNSTKNKLTQENILKEDNLKSFSISPKLATLTLAQVLENQGLFVQAINVLNILSKKGKNVKKITQEISRIKKRIKNAAA